MMHRCSTRLGSGLLALAALAAAVGVSAAGASNSRARGGTQNLIGTFKLTPGACAGGVASGSYFRMIFPGGTIAGGKFFANPDSSCADTSYTPVAGGTQGGLVTGKFQPTPATPFDASGNALANAITAPETFTAIKFGLATNPKDPQSGAAAPAPSIQVKNGRLSGQVEALTAEWNKQYFNQGSPKPGGSRPGLTASVTGTFNARTHAFVLEWASSVVGGPFNGFTGYWHLQGTFHARK